MKKTSTLKELTQFLNAEEDQLKDLGNHQQQVRGPRNSVIDSILGYSKALRITESDNIGQQDLILN